jgi:hypothetical protein
VAVSESVIEAPVQTVDGPEIVPATGRGLTVNAYPAVASPQLLITV